eukprot:m.89046 g.89046  ORF g.89046 m.89046 type:complete len:59 (+) comp12878_c0_seq5:86-262(+)
MDSMLIRKSMFHQCPHNTLHREFVWVTRHTLTYANSSLVLRLLVDTTSDPMKPEDFDK